MHFCAFVQAVQPAKPRASVRGRVQVYASATEVKRADVPLELEEIGLPMNTYGPKTPFTGKVKSVERIVGPKATGETCHIIIETNGDIPFVEGQSYGVIPPGTKVNSKGKEVPHGTRLYSIASTRYGDSFDGKTASLCVRRATYWDPELGKEDPAKKGICSNFLCDAPPGTEITMTGPTGKVLLLPEDPNSVVIMVATGTGIAHSALSGAECLWKMFQTTSLQVWHGCLWELPTPMPSCMMTRSSQSLLLTPISSGWTMPCPGNRPTAVEERCTFKIRWRNTQMKFSIC